MTAFATAGDLAIRMRTTFTEADEVYADMVLDEIGSYLEQLVDVDGTDEVQASNLHYASLSMAARIMQSTLASEVASMTTQAGVYSETVTYHPYTTNNLWKLLKSSGYASRLGVGNDIGFARPSYGKLEADDD